MRCSIQDKPAKGDIRGGSANATKVIIYPLDRWVWGKESVEKCLTKERIVSNVWLWCVRWRVKNSKLLNLCLREHLILMKTIHSPRINKGTKTMPNKLDVFMVVLAQKSISAISLKSPCQPFSLELSNPGVCTQTLNLLGFV